MRRARARGWAGVIVSGRMSRRRSGPLGARIGSGSARRGLCLLALIGLGLSGCNDRNRGISPDGAGLYFPAGAVLDPRIPEGTPARWMFVLNANSDLVFNAGTLVPVDLERFFKEWMRDPEACFKRKDVDGDGIAETEDGDAEACQPGRPPGDAKKDNARPWTSWPEVGDVGDEPSARVPCRHNALKPQVVECEDTYFIEEDAEVQIGNFGTSLRGWTASIPQPGAPAKSATLLVAVRGDPSITLIDVAGPLDEPPVLRCGQGLDSGQYDPRRCSGNSLLTRLRNDPDGTRMDTEPATILATPGDPQVLVSHATRSQITVIDLEGQYTLRSELSIPQGETRRCKGVGEDEVCKDGKPAIVHAPTVFDLSGQPGAGWGLARRPCFAGTDNVPALTITRDPNGEPVECGRSLIYAGFRTNLVAARTFISEATPLDSEYLELIISDLAGRIATLGEAIAEEADPAKKAALVAEQEALKLELGRYEALAKRTDDKTFGQRCLTAGEVSDDELLDDLLSYPRTEGAFFCDARLYTAGAFTAAAFDVGVGGSNKVLGDIGFSQDGNRMFAVQTTPGALAYVDTSLDARGLTRDYTAGFVELCAQPTAMALFADGANEYAAVTCYKPQELFIVDLSGLRVVANIILGTGPHAMTVDKARQYLYVANSLDKTISVVDLSRLRPTRFSEVARIGRQVPYLR
jgi:hypothetical protein